MAEFPAIPLWTDALLADTGHLDDVEFGLYMRLLIVMWRSPDCRVPNDPAWIAKRLRLAPLEYRSKVLPIVEEFCVTDGNYISQKRLLKEFHFVRKMSKDQSARALKKWSKIRDQKESVSDKPMEQQVFDLSPSDAPTPTPTPTELSKDNSPYSPPKDDGGGDWFEERFWKTYPKQRAGSKDAARKAMTKALTKTTKEEIENAVTQYAQSDEVARGYAKGAAAWLNDERWTHQYQPAAGPARRPGNVQKTGYLDKVADAGARASEIIKNRMASESDQPWGGGPLRIAQGPGALPDGDFQEIPRGDDVIPPRPRR